MKHRYPRGAGELPAASKLRVVVVALLMGSGILACATRKSGEPTPAHPGAPPAAGSPAAQYQAAPAAPQSTMDSTGGETPPPAQPSTTPGHGSFAPPPTRSAALRHASADIEVSQRELDVAGGDCRNACRALGSMDRAAGRLCDLAQSSDEQRRCEDAKVRVYSARDKVRNTCGTCPDVTVERSAPVPSR